MKKRHNKTGKKLRLVPFIVGIYGVLLGLGLAVIGLSGIAEGIGIIRILLGLVMTCFGLYGIWDGVRDLVRPKQKPESPVIYQFILTDISGNRSSNVTMEHLRKQLESIMGSKETVGFHLQILPPLPVKEQGMLKQVSCIYQDRIILAAFFETTENKGRIYPDVEPDMAEEWLKQLLSGTPDFSGWESIEIDARQNEAAPGWHQRLIIFGESWHDEHKFFSAKDLELAVEGLHDGKYRIVVLEWGLEEFDISPGRQNDLMIVWRTNAPGEENFRFYEREGTAVQVKFWLINFLEYGHFKEMSGWNDITDQIKKERRKQEKHGKIF